MTDKTQYTNGLIEPQDTGVPTVTEFADVSGLARSRFRVLAVDDESKVLTLMVRVIESAGFAALGASSAAAALDKLSAGNIDLVVTDIRMPHTSGVELAEEVSSRFRDTDIAFITGYTDYDSIARAIRLQPVGFLEKPFDPEQLMTVVERSFNNHAQVHQWEKSNELLRQAVESKTRELEFQSERLLIEKEMMHEIVASANFGLIAIDLEGRLHLLNNFAITLLNMPEVLRGSYHAVELSSSLSQELADKLLPMISRVQSTEQLCEENVSIDDGARVLNVIAYPLCFRQTMTGIVLIIHDRTEREMLQKRLLQTAKLASIGELAAGVAHEINNPLGFVTSNCNSLGEYNSNLMRYLDLLDEVTAACTGQCRPRLKSGAKAFDIDYIRQDTRTLIDETLAGLSRVSRIVRDLKTFARMDADSPESAQVNKIIEDALNISRNELKYKLTVETDLADLPEIPCFPNQLVQVFTNLFVNAAHAVKEKGTLRITSRLRSRHVEVDVTDDGEGIADEHVGRIFDPFFTTKAPGKGTGMGLSISYGIIERHGGTIIVESEKGSGTSFIILLPLANPEEAQTR